MVEVLLRAFKVDGMPRWWVTVMHPFTLAGNSSKFKLDKLVAHFRHHQTSQTIFPAELNMHAVLSG